MSFAPMYHFIDAHIRAHVFYCVLALMIAHLMRRHAHQHGLHLSVRALLDALAGIEKPSCSTSAPAADPKPAA